MPEPGAPPPKRAATFVLLATGVLLFALAPDLKNQWLSYLILIIAAGVTAIPKINHRLTPWLDRLRSPSTKIKAITFSILFVISARYFLFSADAAGRGLFPTLHDEFMYLLQARMLARGRLWMPAHPLADFFDCFNVIVRPVYAAEYFPGTGLFYVPGDWLDAGPWATSVVIAGLAVAMLYLVITRLVDGVAGMLAALLALALHTLRTISVMTMSHPAMLLLFLLAAWSYLRWRQRPTLTAALAVGIFSGWAAITRPLDAVLLLLPIGLSILVRLWHGADSSARRRWLTIILLIAGAAPFISLQLIFDKRVTGSFLRTPFAQWASENVPGLTLGFGPRPVPTTSPSRVAQVRDYYGTFLQPDLRSHGKDGFITTWLAQRLKPAADTALPAHLLFVLLPLGVAIACRDPQRRALAAGILLLPLAYTLYPSYLTHYGLVLAPACILLVLFAADALRRRWPAAGAPLTLAFVALAIASLPEVNGKRDPFLVSPWLADVNDKLAHLDHTPAVVLFRYQSGAINVNLVHHEPVFNIDTAWPDDAPVIRAHDLGPRNAEIFAYYAARQPNRFFYRYDRATMELTPLGFATDLARSHPRHHDSSE
jgi:hypothetical protein